MEKKYYLDQPGLAYYHSKLKQYIDDHIEIYCDTKEHWDEQPELVGRQNCLYIYSDWGESPDGKKIAGFKLGDGETLLMDLPFTDQEYADHIHDTVCHITQQERSDWNNKVSCFYINSMEKLLFVK